ncbi:HAD family phosphatase [Polaribacter undariae]|uniref:HAD family phosphatase n=1 Tax=Polaribacter sejongensis TaxID=985043 RepID=A0AAJ1VHK2_9FLAO|nr:HAD family phosphatase [Polaribacter undariae]MDN3620756.1 HAD family phosphatase [Polaribacter undariae]UWD31356.1 HAD family phosphatase [Polaribacter undariae]
MILPKGFLFDFDGVIVDSFESHYSAWTSAFKELFDKDITPFPKMHAGKSPMIIAEYFCSVIGEEKRTKELFLLKDEHIKTHFKVPTLLPGVREFTSLLSEEKTPYGIASNATKLFLKNSIHHLNLNFPTVFGVQDYVKPKPAPEAYILLAETLGFKEIDFKDIWVFEDSLTGTKAAKAAGMVAIGITTQYTAEELKEAGSVLVFPTLLEAYEYLTK